GVGHPVKTTEKIDIEKLKQPDPILYYNELILYQDELSDNGDSSMSVKLVRYKNKAFVNMVIFRELCQIVFSFYFDFGCELMESCFLLWIQEYSMNSTNIICCENIKLKNLPSIL